MAAKRGRKAGKAKRPKASKKAGKRKKPKTAKKTKKVKHVRKGPTISANDKSVSIGTICYGNDGLLWKVKVAGKSRRWVRAKMQAAAHAEHKFRSGPCASKVHRSA